MTSDEQLHRQQLDVATSRSMPPDARLDAETSALRDGFMALGREAEAAGADYDEQALIARVRSACASQPTPPARAMTPRGWSLLLGGILAACALVAAVRIAAIWPAAGDAVVVVEPQAPRDTQIAQGGSPQAEDESSGLAWDDPLDDEIAAAESSLANLSGGLTGIDGALSDMDQTLEALADDVSGGSL
jgi:hypothetical protein